MQIIVKIFDKCYPPFSLKCFMKQMNSSKNFPENFLLFFVKTCVCLISNYLFQLSSHKHLTAEVSKGIWALV